MGGRDAAGHMGTTTTAGRSAPLDREDATTELAGDDRFEHSLRTEQPWLWWLTLVGPPALAAAGIAAVGWWRGWSFVSSLLMAAVSAFFIFGRFAIFLAGEGEPERATTLLTVLTAEEWLGLLFFMDFLCAVLWAFHIDFAFQIPWAGPKFQALIHDGRFFVEKYPWMRRATFLANLLFVTIPLAGTGSIGGSIFGRLLGQSRGATFAAVVLGSLAGNLAMYFFGATIAQVLPKESPVVSYGGIVLLAAGVILVNWAYQRWKSAGLEEAATAAAGEKAAEKL